MEYKTSEKSFLTLNEAVQTCLYNDSMAKTEIDNRTNELNKKIEKLNKKISAHKTKEKKLEDRVKELENQKWKYKVGDVVLFDGWRKVKITGLTNDAGYLYIGDFIDTSASGLVQVDIAFKQEELSEYKPYEYTDKLLAKIFELKKKLNEINGYGKYF